MLPLHVQISSIQFYRLHLMDQDSDVSVPLHDGLFSSLLSSPGIICPIGRVSKLIPYSTDSGAPPKSLEVFDTFEIRLSTVSSSLIHPVCFWNMFCVYQVHYCSGWNTYSLPLDYRLQFGWYNWLVCRIYWLPCVQFCVVCWG